MNLIQAARKKPVLPEVSATPVQPIDEENILTVVVALNNVVRLAQNNDSGHARHPHNLPLARRKVNK